MCARCGEHPINLVTFNAHTTPEARKAMKALVPSVTKARIRFHNGCPMCLPQNKTHEREAELEVSQT
jgi:hypothetical protein